MVHGLTPYGSVGRRRPGDAPEIDDIGLDVEPPGQLFGPLLTQTRRRENQDAVGGAARPQLGRDRAPPGSSFRGPLRPRSAPAGKAAHDRQGRLELVRQQIDPRAFRRLQAVRRAVRLMSSRQRRAAAACRDQGEPPRPHRRFDVVERRDDVAVRPAFVRDAPASRHDLTGRARTNRNDAPRWRRADDIASPKDCSFIIAAARATCRNCYAGSEMLETRTRRSTRR